MILLQLLDEARLLGARRYTQVQLRSAAHELELTRSGAITHMGIIPRPRGTRLATRVQTVPKAFVSFALLGEKVSTIVLESSVALRRVAVFSEEMHQGMERAMAFLGDVLAFEPQLHKTPAFGAGAAGADAAAEVCSRGEVESSASACPLVCASVASRS